MASRGGKIWQRGVREKEENDNEHNGSFRNPCITEEEGGKGEENGGRGQG